MRVIMVNKLYMSKGWTRDSAAGAVYGLVYIRYCIIILSVGMCTTGRFSVGLDKRGLSLYNLSICNLFHVQI